MKYELKKVKCYPAMSEETECFSAEIWVGNKHIAYVKNDGRGGSNDVQPAKGYTYEDVKPFDNIDTECEIMERVIEIDMVKKHQSKGFITKKGDKIMIFKFPKPITEIKKYAKYTTWLKIQTDTLTSQGNIILNTNL